jgi:hypothetical protein
MEQGRPQRGRRDWRDERGTSFTHPWQFRQWRLDANRTMFISPYQRVDPILDRRSVFNFYRMERGDGVAKWIDSSCFSRLDQSHFSANRHSNNPLLYLFAIALISWYLPLP